MDNPAVTGGALPPQPNHQSDASDAANPTPAASEHQPSKQSSADNSVASSPLASRESSPTRNPRRASSSSRLAGSRPRKNSQQELSPARQMRSSIPGPAPNSRSLSSAPTPALPAPNEPQVQSSTPQKPIITDIRDSPRWPVSPRLRSPPPQLNKPGVGSRRGEHDPPAISIQRPSPSPHPPSDSQQSTSDSDGESSEQTSGMRTPIRGALETVQEVSLPNSPSPTTGPVLLEHVKEKLSADNQSDAPLHDSQTLRARPRVPGTENGSESGSGRTETRRTASVPPPLVTRQSSAMSSKQGKAKPEGSTQNMTVETETVSSIPQVALSTGSKADSVNGSLKAKPSTETIRPKKDRKKITRKQPVVNSGTGETQHPFYCYVQPKLRHHQSRTSMSVLPDDCLSPTSPGGQYPPADEAGSPRTFMSGPRTNSLGFNPMSTLLTRSRPASSKADIFEAKIASAVDEANTSDSEETFVYDSNPPDGGDRAARRFHSRTPSATSMASQADRQHPRSIYGILEGGGPAIGPKKTMKFVTTSNGNGADSLSTVDDDGKGTGRSAGGSGRGTARHHHIGRWGRQPGNGHPSLFDNESPFPNAARPKLPGNNSRTTSNPPSPRNHHSARGHLSTKRSSIQMSSSYDMDDTTGADDERTPLIGSTRSTRFPRNRRSGPHNLRQAESQTFTRRSSYLNRFAACLVLTMMFLLVITGVIGFMFATSQPMTDIEITSISNVVTSEQVLMFDLTVRAHNPNIVVITIDQANLEIFAKSEHAGTDADWREGPDDVHITDDPINDPPLDGGDDELKPNVLLGRITEFDSPLTFEGSLFHQGPTASTGEMQLANPGNGTSGGSERWDRIYQNEFDLIVKGVVKYSLPLSARIRSATISGRTTVKPNSANDPSLLPNNTLPEIPS